MYSKDRFFTWVVIVGALSLPPSFLLEPIVSEKSFGGIHCQVRTCLECDLLIISVITNVFDRTDVENIYLLPTCQTWLQKILKSEWKMLFLSPWKYYFLKLWEVLFSIRGKSMFWQYSFERASYFQLVPYRSIFFPTELQLLLLAKLFSETAAKTNSSMIQLVKTNYTALLRLL